jgi:hypothetical protein
MITKDKKDRKEDRKDKKYEVDNLTGINHE